MLTRSPPVFGIWQPMETAPKDGRRILAAVWSSEQWPAEIELVRWATPRHGAEPCWVAADSGPNSTTIFSETELRVWMPLPPPPTDG